MECFDWDAPAIENDMFFLRHFLRRFFCAVFFCAISFIKISFFPLNGQINRIVSKKIKQGQNYHPKFSISHFFQNFQHFFYLMNNRKKAFNFEWNKSMFNPYVLLKTNLFERRILSLVHKKNSKNKHVLTKTKWNCSF